MNKRITLVHPGEILDQEFLKPLNVTEYRLAKDIDVPARRINEIVHGTRSVTADTALRLGKFFGTTPQFWLNLQSQYDLLVGMEEISAELKKNVKVLAIA